MIRALLREVLAAKGVVETVVNASDLKAKLEALEAKVASIPEPKEPSPEAGMNTMKKALVENELTELRNRRKRLKRRDNSKDAN